MRRAPKNPRRPGESCEKRGHCPHDLNGGRGLLPAATSLRVRCCWCGTEYDAPSVVRFAFPPNYYTAGHGDAYTGEVG